MALFRGTMTSNTRVYVPWPFFKDCLYDNSFLGKVMMMTLPFQYCISQHLSLRSSMEEIPRDTGEGAGQYVSCLSKVTPLLIVVVKMHQA